MHKRGPDTHLREAVEAGGGGAVLGDALLDDGLEKVGADRGGREDEEVRADGDGAEAPGALAWGGEGRRGAG
jgi:hypothetical protein